MTIKTKLTAAVVAVILSVSAVITLFSVSKSSSALEHSEFNKLSSVEVAKHEEIGSYFDYLGGLLTSLAAQEGTKEAFLAFDNGFYKLEDELHLNVDQVTAALKANFASEYLSKVNYDVPNSQPKKPIDVYLPKNVNAKIAQYIFIVANSAKLGEKNELTYNAKYDSSYMQAHKNITIHLTHF